MKRALNGGLWGYAFVASLAVHLLVWAIFALPRDDAGSTLETKAPSPAASVEKALHGDDKPTAPAALDRGAGFPRADRGAAVTPARAPRDKTDNTGWWLASGPPETTPRALPHFRDGGYGATTPAVDAAVALPVGPEGGGAYVDEGGGVRNAAAAASGDLVAAQNRAKLAALKDEYKAAREQGRPAAAAQAIITSTVGRLSRRPTFFYVSGTSTPAARPDVGVII